MNEGRDSDACTRATRALLAGPWGITLVVTCCIVILRAVPAWGV